MYTVIETCLVDGVTYREAFAPSTIDSTKEVLNICMLLIVNLLKKILF